MPPLHPDLIAVAVALLLGLGLLVVAVAVAMAALHPAALEPEEPPARPPGGGSLPRHPFPSPAR
jgi:hypothetical protein